MKPLVYGNLAEEEGGTQSPWHTGDCKGSFLMGRRPTAMWHRGGGGCMQPRHGEELGTLAGGKECGHGGRRGREHLGQRGDWGSLEGSRLPRMRCSTWHHLSCWGGTGLGAGSLEHAQEAITERREECNHPGCAGCCSACIRVACRMATSVPAPHHPASRCRQKRTPRSKPHVPLQEKLQNSLRFLQQERKEFNPKGDEKSNEMLVTVSPSVHVSVF